MMDLHSWILRSSGRTLQFGWARPDGSLGDPFFDCLILVAAACLQLRASPPATKCASAAFVDADEVETLRPLLSSIAAYFASIGRGQSAAGSGENLEHQMLPPTCML